MKRSIMCSAAVAAVALATSSARAVLVYSFETLYDNTNMPNPAGTRPDDFAKNGGGTTVTQSTIGVTNGSFSMEFQQLAGATFTGALTTVIPAIINDPSTQALSFDLTVPSTGNFVGNFARIGISEFGADTEVPPVVQQAQTIASSEANIDLAPGLYHFTIPLIAIADQLGNVNVPFSSIFPSQLAPTSFEFYINKSTENPLTVYMDNVQTVGPATNGTWAKTTGGSWSTLANWTGGIPTLALDTANLTSAITTSSTVTLDGNQSVMALNFNNTKQYTIAPGTGGTLTLDAGGTNTSTVVDAGGTHVISAPVDFNTNTTITVNNAPDALNISGNISGIGSLTTMGSGTTELSGSNSYVGGTTVSSGVLLVGNAMALPTSNAVVNIAAGATMKLATGIGGVTLQLPNITAGGIFDVNNDHVFINYTTTDPFAAVRALLQTGYASGAWTGPGINSSAAAANHSYTLGYADGATANIPGLSSGQIEIAYTLYGDINLDGVVNGTDFGILAGNFGKTVTGGWQQGDLNFDGTVNGTDFGLLAGNFGKSASGRAITLPASEWAALDAFAASHGLLSDVPEPTSMGLLTIAGAGLLAARRRK
jgi:autotransporter-associated beta strand protein